VFFLWRHFTSLQAKDEAEDKSSIEKMKKELSEQLREAQSAPSDARDAQKISQLSTALKRL
jgi:hypothetical protein